MITAAKNKGLDILVENENLIDNNKFEELYNNINSQYPLIVGYIIPVITQLLLEAGINPLPYMKTVPPHYMDGVMDFEDGKKFESIDIPNRIEAISEDAFLCCLLLKKVKISNKLKILRHQAFRGCIGISSINLPLTLQYIAPDVFTECSQLEDIYYEGTIKQWGSIKKEGWIKSSFGDTIKINIHCKDGDTVEYIE